MVMQYFNYINNQKQPNIRLVTFGLSTIELSDDYFYQWLMQIISWDFHDN